MAYEDPNAPSSAPAPTTTPAAATPEKKPGSWDWLWPSILAVIIVKLFGLVGGLVRIPAKLNSHSGQREHPDP